MLLRSIRGHQDLGQRNPILLSRCKFLWVVQWKWCLSTIRTSLFKFIWNERKMRKLMMNWTLSSSQMGLKVSRDTFTQFFQKSRPRVSKSTQRESCLHSRGESFLQIFPNLLIPNFMPYPSMYDVLIMFILFIYLCCILDEQ